MQRSMPALLLALVAVTTVAACGDSSGPEEANVVGTYQLQTVNGRSLPANPGMPLAGAPDIISRALTLNTYTRSGDTVEVSVPPRTVMAMVFTDGNTLTYTQVMDTYEHVYVYRK